MATLSIRGLYEEQPTIFDGLVLPEGVDHELIVSKILESCAELEVLFTNPAYIERSVMMWSRRNINIWNKLWNSTNFEYNPIENYRRNEKWKENGKSNSVGKTSGYNSIELVDSAGNDSNVENAREGLTYGNIGVTTTQQMIKEEREVVKFNIYDYIADSFKAEYCLMIY